MFYTQKKLGWLFDWKKIKAYLEQKYQVLELRYYIGVKFDEVSGDETGRNYVRFLSRVGYIPVIKPVKKIRLEPPQQGHIFKANFDVEMTCDILLAADRFDHLVLLSGDSDFAYLLEIMKRRGKEITIVCSRGTLGWELKLATKRHIYLEDLRGQIYWKDWGRRGSVGL